MSWLCVQVQASLVNVLHNPQMCRLGVMHLLQLLLLSLASPALSAPALRHRRTFWWPRRSRSREVACSDNGCADLLSVCETDPSDADPDAGLLLGPIEPPPKFKPCCNVKHVCAKLGLFKQHRCIPPELAVLSRAKVQCGARQAFACCCMHRLKSARWIPCMVWSLTCLVADATPQAQLA